MSYTIIGDVTSKRLQQMANRLSLKATRLGNLHGVPTSEAATKLASDLENLLAEADDLIHMVRHAREAMQEEEHTRVEYSKH